MLCDRDCLAFRVVLFCVPMVHCGGQMLIATHLVMLVIHDRGLLVTWLHKIQGQSLFKFSDFSY